jgi:hypothetical protein
MSSGGGARLPSTRADHGKAMVEVPGASSDVDAGSLPLMGDAPVGSSCCMGQEGRRCRSWRMSWSLS